MNSADKRKDTGDGRLLGMDKTTTRTNGNDWIQQRAVEAARDVHPLDIEMGTGALNVGRAVEQLDQAEQDFGEVDTRGWDFELTFENGDTHAYEFDEKLVGGSWVAATLAWDRIVPLTENWDGIPNQPGDTTDFGAPGVFDAELLVDVDSSGGLSEDDLFSDLNGDDAFQSGNRDSFDTANTLLPDLDLYLVPKGATSTAEAVARSVSTIYTVEHIFFQLPAGNAEYELWVEYSGGVTDPIDYGFSWWAMGISQIPEPHTLLLISSALPALLLNRRRKMK